MIYLLHRIRAGRRDLAYSFRGLPELLDWCAARWPEIPWQEKPASLLLDLIEAESRYEFEVERVDDPPRMR